jgi:hypothetical protein
VAPALLDLLDLLGRCNAMAWLDDVLGEMERMPLDEVTDERLLAGAIEFDDVPPAYAGVARLMKALTAPPIDSELEQRGETILAMKDVLSTRPAGSHRIHGRFSGMSMSVKLRLIAVTVAALLVLGTGLAFAGSLPAGAQKVASGVLAKIGITVPGRNSHATTHANDASTEAPPEAAWFGLCTAWQSGQGGEEGKKDQATAFARLSAAAGDASVQDFCTGVIAKHDAAVSSGNAGSNPGTSTADTRSGGKSDSGLDHRP